MPSPGVGVGVRVCLARRLWAVALGSHLRTVLRKGWGLHRAEASQPSCGQIAAFGADREAPKLLAARIPWLTEGKKPIRIAASLRYHALGYRAAGSSSHRI